MTVGVVIPLYNKKATIRKAVESILAQTYRDLHIYVIDDGSTDGSSAEVEAIGDPRITIVRQENAGPGAARNHGARLAEGPYVAFLDADDEWMPDHLEVAMAKLEANPECALFACSYFIGSERESRESRSRSMGITGGISRLPSRMDAITMKYYVDFCHSSCVVCRKDVFEAYGGYYDRNRCVWGEDAYIWLQFLLGHPAYLDPVARVWFHTEYSELGVKPKGTYPMRPTLTDVGPIRKICPPGQAGNLARLLAFYRLIETEALLLHGTAKSAEIRRLQAEFPWPELPTMFMLAREIRVRLLMLANRFRSWSNSSKSA
jgi:glycosyltransferase involved in cell wall biosynthesis